MIRKNHAYAAIALLLVPYFLFIGVRPLNYWFMALIERIVKWGEKSLYK